MAAFMQTVALKAPSHLTLLLGLPEYVMVMLDMVGLSYNVLLKVS